MNVDVVIIGGGISGLATADALARAGRRVLVLERQARPGGNAVSERAGGFLMEHGPSTVTATSDIAVEATSRLGLDPSRCDLGAGVKNRYLVSDGKLSGISTHPLGFLLSGYLSLPGRLRVMGEIAVPRKKVLSDETVWSFFSRRFGAEFADQVVDPMIGGIFAGLARDTSMAAAFPKLIEFERQYGSLARALIGRTIKGQRMPASRLFSFTGGVATLPHAMARELGTRVRTGVVVKSVERAGGDFQVVTERHGTVSARSVIVATQPHVASRIVEKLDADAAQATGEIAAPPLAVVFLGYRREDVEHPLDGLGFLAARDEGLALTGAQFCSTMFPGRAPQGHVSMAGYLGGARNPGLASRSREELLDLVRRDFADLVGARGEPVFAQVRHWPRGLPQYAPGHAARVQITRQTDRRTPGLFLTGNYLGGVSVANCLGSATETAAHADEYLGQTARAITPVATSL